MGRLGDWAVGAWWRGDTGMGAKDLVRLPVEAVGGVADKVVFTHSGQDFGRDGRRGPEEDTRLGLAHVRQQRLGAREVELDKGDGLGQVMQADRDRRRGRVGKRCGPDKRGVRWAGGVAGRKSQAHPSTHRLAGRRG